MPYEEMMACQLSLVAMSGSPGVRSLLLYLLFLILLFHNSKVF
jgi:hypothetical protein